MPACYAQAVSQGVDYIVQNREKLARKLAFRHDPHATFFPLDSDPKFRLGEEYGPPVAWVVAAGGAALAPRRGFTKLCQTKNINGGKIMRLDSTIQPASCHVAM